MLEKTAFIAALLVSAPLAAQDPCFDGTGGPNGDFDWVVRSGTIFFFDTTATDIVGGPDGVPTSIQHSVNGVVDLRRLIIEEGGEIRVQGPNSMRILATGDVVVRGRLNISGFNAKDVATLNTGNQMEIGAAGAGGGGRGGNANVNTTDSSPRGGPGGGPFATTGATTGGGQGGETGYAPSSLGKDARRPGGGGGGRFARDQGPLESASSGNDGHPSGKGAESGLNPARGGSPGVGPFVDGKPGNDFFGVKPVVGGRGLLLQLIRGELPAPWAGYGGGGGGNADPASTFPTPGWNFASDEKGGAGGGAGGQLHVQALGAIVFGAQGEIRSNGGKGGTGENTNFLDHVGGTGGGASAGHIVLESATRIDFTDGGANVLALPRDWLLALGPPIKTGPTSDVNPCCRTYSNGGAGGPGVIQLHVPDPVTQPGINPGQHDIVVPFAVAASRFPLDQLASPAAIALFPTCDPFARQGYGWLGAGAGHAFLRMPWEDDEPVEGEPLFDLGLGIELDLEGLRLP